MKLDWATVWFIATPVTIPSSIIMHEIAAFVADSDHFLITDNRNAMIRKTIPVVVFKMSAASLKCTSDKPAYL